MRVVDFYFVGSRNPLCLCAYELSSRPNRDNIHALIAALPVRRTSYVASIFATCAQKSTTEKLGIKMQMCSVYSLM
jgi:hypothetical protein